VRACPIVVRRRQEQVCVCVCVCVCVRVLTRQHSCVCSHATPSS
jgi:hypothetical protein